MPGGSAAPEQSGFLWDPLPEKDRVQDLEEMLERSKLYSGSREYLELLDFVTRMPHIAPFNALLLNIQKPGLRFAATGYDWKKRFDRTIREGARPLVVLRPFGPVALVYDVEDTEGAPLPSSVAQAFRAQGDITEFEMLNFEHRLWEFGVYLKFIPYGESLAGFIGNSRLPDWARDEMKVGRPMPVEAQEELVAAISLDESEHRDVLEVESRSNEPKQRPAYRIRINSNHDPNVQFATLTHELAHLYLGHLGEDRFLKISERTDLGHERQELEAESVACLVCRRAGVQANHERYLRGYLERHFGATGFTWQVDVEAVMIATGKVENALGMSERVSWIEPRIR